MCGLAREKSLLERPLHRVEHLCLRFWQIACEITQKSFLTETSFIAIKYDACRRGRRRKRLGQGGVILASVRRSRSHVDKRRDVRMHTGFSHDHSGKRMTNKHR